MNSNNSPGNATEISECVRDAIEPFEIIGTGTKRSIGYSVHGTILDLSCLAYHIKTGVNSTIGAGLLGGFGQRSIDPGGLQWGAQYNGIAYDPNLASGESVSSSSFTFVDLGLGAVWHYSSNAGAKDVAAKQSTQATLGFGYFHVTRPTYTFLNAEEQLNAKLVLHGNARFGLGESNSAILPSFQYSKQGPSSDRKSVV